MIGRGDNLHHLVYVDDLIDGMQAAAREEQAIGEIVVLVGPEAITTREMVAHVAAAVGQKPPWLRLPLGPLILLATTLEFVLAPIGVQPPLHRRRMNFFTRSFKFGGDKARAVLNFQPKIGFGRGAELTAAWYRDKGLSLKVRPSRQSLVGKLVATLGQLQIVDKKLKTQGFVCWTYVSQ